MRLRLAARLMAVLVWASVVLPGQTHQAGVDPRVELFGIIFRLAGNSEYMQGQIPAYEQAVNSWFAPWRDHQAVRTAREFRQNYGVGYDAVMSLAIHVADVDTLAERTPFDGPGSKLDSRWHGAAARRFLDAARRFVADTRFADFLASQQELIDLTNSRLREWVENGFDFPWFERFFGPRALRFRTVAALLNGPSSYGVSFVDADGVLETYAIIGLTLRDENRRPVFSNGYLPVLVHEFTHSHANPLVDQFAAELEPAGQRLFEATRDQMRGQGYGTGRTVLYETLVRASTVQYIAGHDSAGAADTQIRYEHEMRSFLWIGELAKVLRSYEADREAYPTMESFMPRLIDALNQAAIDPKSLPRRYEESRPKVVEVSVPEGSTDIDPALAEIVLRFDRRMSGQSSVLPRVPDLFPKVTKVEWDEALTTCTIRVSLEPERDYEMYINAPGRGNFASDEGVWLKPLTVWFRTRAAEPPAAEAAR